MSLEAAGHRILVKPDPVEEISAGGIVIATASTTNREKRAKMTGTLVGIGPNAWKGFDDGKPWAELGQKVYYEQYTGWIIQDPETKEDVVVMNDNDVIAVVR